MSTFIYKHSPLKMRRIVLHCSNHISDDVYLKRIEQWNEILKEDFPDVDVRPSWNLDMKEPKNIWEAPIIKSSTFKLKPQYRNLNKTLGVTLDVKSDRIIIDFISSQKIQHIGFSTIPSLIMPWINKWIDLWDVKKIVKSELIYFNQIDLNPLFTNSPYIQLTDYFTFLPQIATQQDWIANEINTSIVMSLSDKGDKRIVVKTQNGQNNTFSIILGCLALFRSPEDLSNCVMSQFQNILNEKHDIIFRYFPTLFTKKMLEAFKPEHKNDQQ